MNNIRLIRCVPSPTGSGPGNGQYALQKALRRYAPDWLKIGGSLRRGEIPWFWCWEDREVAAMCAQAGEAFVAGPNILFAESSHPCRIAAEREICNAASCRLLFTKSGRITPLPVFPNNPQKTQSSCVFSSCLSALLKRCYLPHP